MVGSGRWKAKSPECTSKRRFERIVAALHDAMLDDTRWAIASALIDEACGLTASTKVSISTGSTREPGPVAVRRRWPGYRIPASPNAYPADVGVRSSRYPALRPSGKQRRTASRFEAGPGSGSDHARCSRAAYRSSGTPATGPPCGSGSRRVETVETVRVRLAPGEQWARRTSSARFRRGRRIGDEVRDRTRRPVGTAQPAAPT